MSASRSAIQRLRHPYQYCVYPRRFILPFAQPSTHPPKRVSIMFSSAAFKKLKHVSIALCTRANTAPLTMSHTDWEVEGPSMFEQMTAVERLNHAHEMAHEFVENSRNSVFEAQQTPGFPIHRDRFHERLLHFQVLSIPISAMGHSTSLCQKDAHCGTEKDGRKGRNHGVMARTHWLVPKEHQTLLSNRV